MSDARCGDPREFGERDCGDERPNVCDERVVRYANRVTVDGSVSRIRNVIVTDPNWI